MVAPIITFHPFQKKWLHDESRFKVGMFARQTGKTFTTCAEIADDCIQAEIANKRARWVILSRGERQAKEAMDEALKPTIKAFYTLYEGLQKPIYQEEAFKVGSGDIVTIYRALEVIFMNGSRITALPANPDTARGFSANVLLDEFAFHADSRAIWAALFPVISKGKLKLRVISTPNGKGNKFYDLMEGDDTIWSRHKVDIYKAVEDGLDRDIEALRAGMADEDAWAQEYELNWLDAASAWLDYDLISACESADAGTPEAYGGGACFVGVDIAARNDLFVIWVLEQVGGRLVTREIIAQRRIEFARQDALLADVFRRYRVVQCMMDQSGMGEKPVEDARRLHGASRVQGVLFTTASKLEMATRLKEALQDRRLLLPMGDVKLRADLHSIKAVAGPTGNRRLIADGQSDGHADRFWAGAMAVSAAAMPVAEYDYLPVQAGRPAGRHDSFMYPPDDDDTQGRSFGAGNRRIRGGGIY